MIQTAVFDLPGANRPEILRYSGAKEETPALSALLDEALAEARPVLTGSVCWTEFPVSCSDGILDMTVVEDFNDLEIPVLGLMLMTGTVDKAPNIHCYKGKHFTITRGNAGPAHADGDWFEADRVIDIKIIEHALKVIVP